MSAVNATICISTVFQMTDKACCKYHSTLRHPTWNSPSNLFRGLQNAMCSQVYLIVHDMNSISWAGTSSHFWTSIAFQFGDGNGTPLQYSCLENPMDGGAWWAVVHGVAKSRAWPSDFTFTFHFSLSCIGEGNGNPLQCSRLENPRDGGASWAALSGVAQSWTRLRWLSSSSSLSIWYCACQLCNYQQNVRGSLHTWAVEGGSAATDLLQVGGCLQC